MRWTKNDTLAFEAVSKAGKGLREAYEQSQMADAYNTGSAVTPDTQAAYGSEQGATDFTGEVGPTSGEVKTRYGLGANPTSYSDTKPTEEQRHVAGLRSQMARAGSRGDTEASGKLLERIQASESHGKQMKAAELTIDAAEEAKRRRDVLKAADENFKKNVADPAKYIEQGFNTDAMGSMPGVKVQVEKTATGYKGRLFGPDGQPVEGQSIKHLTNEQVRDMAFKEHLKETGNVTALAALEQHQAERQQDLDHRERGDVRADKAQTETERHQKEAEKLARGSQGLAAKSLKLQEEQAFGFKPQKIEWQDPITGETKTGSIQIRTRDGKSEVADLNGKPLGERDQRYLAATGQLSAPISEARRDAFAKVRVGLGPRPTNFLLPDNWLNGAGKEHDRNVAVAEHAFGIPKATDRILGKAMSEAERAGSPDPYARKAMPSLRAAKTSMPSFSGGRMSTEELTLALQEQELRDAEERYKKAGLLQYGAEGLRR